MSTPSPVEEQLAVGIDVGAQSTKIVLGSNLSCELVRNDVGGHSLPSCVEFAGSQRKIGQTPTSKSKNVVLQVPRWLESKSEINDDLFSNFLLTECDKQGNLVVQYKDALTTFSPSAIAGMLLKKICALVQATLDRIAPNRSFGIRYMLAIGPQSILANRLEWLDATHAAGMSSVQLVESSLCFLYCHRRKFPEYSGIVLVVDMGHAQTTVSVLGPGAGENKEEEEQSQLQVLGCRQNNALGGGLVDIRLWEHFVSTVPKLKEVSRKSKQGQRLLDGCARLKHLLSQLTEGSVTVENINDHDVPITATRSVLEDLCQKEAEELKSLILSTLHDAQITNVHDLTSIEVSGGGCRIPFIKEVILGSLATDQNIFSLSYSLDETSMAMGAALIGEDTEFKTEEVPPVGGEKEDRTELRQKLQQAEEEMSALDQDMKARSDCMNKIESHILQLRSAKHSKHGLLIPATELDACLDQVENWLFSEEADAATKDDMMKKYEDLVAATDEIAKDYLAKVKEEKELLEKEMEAEAKKAQEERNGEEDEEEDHDNRRLPKKRRMEIVMKNKTEANELFADGNFKFAAARYTKALSHCAKFVDLSPDDTEEVNAVKLSLNLNLALAYTKLGNMDQALRVCNDALAIDGENTKALYRRATVYYEKKKFDLAKKDATKAESNAPGDKALKKLALRIDAQLKRQKQKEKKMAAKMFG